MKDQERQREALSTSLRYVSGMGNRVSKRFLVLYGQVSLRECLPK